MIVIRRGRRLRVGFVGAALVLRITRTSLILAAGRSVCQRRLRFVSADEADVILDDSRLAWRVLFCTGHCRPRRRQRCQGCQWSSKWALTSPAGLGFVIRTAIGKDDAVARHKLHYDETTPSVAPSRARHMCLNLGADLIIMFATRKAHSPASN